jgi:hypothetical protein
MNQNGTSQSGPSEGVRGATGNSPGITGKGPIAFLPLAFSANNKQSLEKNSGNRQPIRAS